MACSVIGVIVADGLNEVARSVIGVVATGGLKEGARSVNRSVRQRLGVDQYYQVHTPRPLCLEQPRRPCM